MVKYAAASKHIANVSHDKQQMIAVLIFACFPTRFPIRLRTKAIPSVIGTFRSNHTESDKMAVATTGSAKRGSVNEKTSPATIVFSRSEHERPTARIVLGCNCLKLNLQIG